MRSCRFHLPEGVVQRLCSMSSVFNGLMPSWTSYLPTAKVNDFWRNRSEHVCFHDKNMFIFISERARGCWSGLTVNDMHVAHQAWCSWIPCCKNDALKSSHRTAWFKWFKPLSWFVFCSETSVLRKQRVHCVCWCTTCKSMPKLAPPCSHPKTGP